MKRILWVGIVVMLMALLAQSALMQGLGDSPLPTPTATITPPAPIPLPVDERSLGVAAVIGSIWILVIPVVMELVPGASTWWNGISADGKRAIRAWGGLVIAVGIVAAHFTGLYDLGLGTTFNFQSIMVIIIAWLVFVFGQETLYQTLKPALPRKQ